ncbi:MAG: hypothetical protein WC974_08605 [Thermoplasmata archaeon]
MKLPTVGNRNIDSNFNTISKEIDALKRAVNARQEGSSQGIPLADGDTRFIKGTDGSGYLEIGGKDGVYTTFQGGLQLKGTDIPYANLQRLTVKEMFASHFTIRQLNAVNGDFLFSDAAEVSKVNGTTITFKDQSNTNTCPFAANDKIITEKVLNSKGSVIKTVKATVVSVAGTSIVITYTGTDRFAVGDVVVRVGNSASTSRQDSIYISTNKSGTPYIDVYDNIEDFAGSGSTFWDNHAPKVRIGRLTGISDADFSAVPLLGHGVYAQNVYLKGKILISNPEANGITTTYRQSADPSLSNDMKLGDLWVNPDSHFLMYRWNGSGWELWMPGMGSATTGLSLTGSEMGYYSGSAWKTYMDSTGNFYLTGGVGATDGYLQWLSATSALTIKGSFTILNPSDNGINTTFRQATAPTVAGDNVKIGDFWFDTTAGVYRLKRCNAITPSVLWDVVGAYIDSTGIYAGTITAGQITTGTLDAATITLGTATTDGILQSYGWNGTANGFQIKGGATPTIGLIGGAITGGTIQTATSGQRVVISGATNDINFYSAAGGVGSIYGSAGFITIGGNLALQEDAYFISNTTGGVQAKVDPLNGFLRSSFDGVNYPSAAFNTDGIYFGVPATRNGSYDTNLYRSAANVLKTDDSFQCANITSINTVTYSFPSVAPTLNQVLTCSNATGGVLSWSAPASMVYPGAGIALSTGSAWGTSIADNSTAWNSAAQWVTDYGSGSRSNWDAAYNDKINSASFNTTTGVITLTQQDAGTVTVDIDGKYLTDVVTLNSVGDVDISASPTGKFLQYVLGSWVDASISATSPITFTSNTIAMPAAATAQNGYLTSTDWNTFNGKSVITLGTTDAGTFSGTIVIKELIINGSGTGYYVLVPN